MNIKLLILPLTVILTSTSIGQGLKVDNLKTDTNTSSAIRWQCNAGPSVLFKGNFPLVIFNGKTFKNCLLQNLFFDIDTITISTIQVLNPRNDSVKLYGKAGKNGVIIINTKRPIEWISARQILKQKSNVIFSSRKKTLIKVDEAFFYTDEELYFQKDMIDNISVTNNTVKYYVNRQFNSVITIVMTKKKSST